MGNGSCSFGQSVAQKLASPLESQEGLVTPVSMSSLGKKLMQLGYNPEEYGLQSLLAGGATAAANAGVPDRNIKRHEKWKFESAKDGYVEDLLESMLRVCKQLSL